VDDDDDLYEDADDQQPNDSAAESAVSLRDRLADGIEYADDEDENAEEKRKPRGRR
jgi:hypothetical protein